MFFDEVGGLLFERCDEYGVCSILFDDFVVVEECIFG